MNHGKVSPGKKNPAKIKELIDSSAGPIKNIENSLMEIESQIIMIEESLKRVYNIIEDNYPINARNIKEYIDTFKKDVDNSKQPLITLIDSLNNTKQSYKELHDYYKNSYLKTMEKFKRGF